MSKTSSEHTDSRIDPTKVEWRHTPWPKLEQYVFKLQKRIFKAAQLRDDKTVRRLQKTLLYSRSAKTLAVPQDNRGKNTAGVDEIKSLTSPQRLTLVGNLKLTGQAMPTRRVCIPKPGTTEKRPLGIPTPHDRALQALVKQALEPQWESRFEANSYGFRPGRSAHDAMEAIYKAINKKAKYVLDADIAKCFDRINHDALLTVYFGQSDPGVSEQTDPPRRWVGTAQRYSALLLSHQALLTAHRLPFQLQPVSFMG